MAHSAVKRMIDSSSSSTPSPGSGNPPEHHAENPTVRAVQAAVRELETARHYIERNLNETREEIKDVRDRLARIETTVHALPSKVWIGGILAAMTVFLTAFIGLLALVEKSLRP